MKQSIHDHQRAYNFFRARLERMTLPDETKKAILEFDLVMAASGNSLSRRVKYLDVLPRIASALHVPLRDVTKQDLMRYITDLDAKGLSVWTTHDYRVIIKRFWKWLKCNDEEYPAEVRWIKTSIPRSKRPRRSAADMLTEAEVDRLIRVSTHPRNRALIATLWDAGGRIGEVGTLWNTDITFDKYGAVISVEGKTGPRPIRLVQAVPYLVEWMSFHPLRTQPKFPLWVVSSNRAKHQPLNYNAIRELLRKAARKAGVTKRVNPHSWRHARASNLAPHLNEFQMNARFGWVHGSAMPGTYIHWSGKETDPAILRLSGIKTEETALAETPLKPVMCTRCDTINATDAKFCRRCGMGIVESDVIAADERVRRHETVLAELLKDEHVRKAIQESLVRRETSLRLLQIERPSK